MWIQAVRSLRRSPGFAIAAIATLALGAGANTAIFSAIDEVLLRPLPVPQGSRLASVYRFNQKTAKYLSTSYPAYEDLRAHSRSFESVAAYVRLQFNLNTGGHAERIPVEAVSGNYFSMMGLAPLAGGTLHEGDLNAVMLGENLWRRRFHADPSLVGRTIYLEDQPFTVAGILPRAFHGPNMNWGDPPEIWMPLAATPMLLPAFRTIDILHQKSVDWLLVIGRLRPGVSVPQAQAELRTLRTDPDIAMTVFPASNAKFWPAYRASIGNWLAIFGCAAGLVLLLACANLSNLLLERGMGRRREFAIRLALGAGRGRVVRQLLTENLLLAVPGFAASLLVAQALQKVLLGFPNAFGISLAMELTVESRVLLFCFAISLAAVALFSVGPALAAARHDVLPALKASGSTTAASGQAWLRQSLVVAQVAFSMMLLVGGGLFGRSLMRAYSLDLGFRSDHLLAMTFSLPRQYAGERAQQFYDEALRRTATVAGVESATLTSERPLSPVHVSGQASASGTGAPVAVNFNMVGPGYLRTAGIPLLAGRDLEARDNTSAVRVAIVNRALAEKLWPGVSPLGRILDFQDRPSRTTRVEVVGVAKDGRYESVWESGEPYLYLSSAEWKWPVASLLVRTSAPPQTTLAAIRREWEADAPQVPLYATQSGEEIVAAAVAPQRLAAMLLGAFGILAILLATVGLYSVMAFSVVRRTREIGIRLAIGARPSSVLRQVLRRAMGVAAMGILLGGAASLAVMRLVASQLRDVSPYDGVTFVAVAVLLAVVSMLAALLPALRAARVDPLRALKYE
ncbi:MAG TPA: ABC transporter permease [Candidatus Sulfopaludibacter sp.]|jgi:predicted permease|nr:ABC transporter permease [Candidatus Sulfopaludibacter sp.]